MRLQDFHFDLPPSLIAQEPLAPRSASRMLCLDGADGRIAHRRFADLVGLLAPGDLLVFNDTRVIRARLFGRKPSGGRVEILIERVLEPLRVLAQLQASKPIREGLRIRLEGTSAADLEVLGRQDGMWLLAFPPGLAAGRVMEQEGHVPLPPYIRGGEDRAEDRERYQTVYARRPGSVAAPTAGLHFDAALLEALERRGVERAFITLHVGAGTFQPVRSEQLEDHVMHSEWLEVPPSVCEQVERTRQAGRRVVAVGSTAVRALESAAAGGRLEAFRGETRIFIYPGYRFHMVDAMITNFHLPGSTLLMLVCAFAGRDAVLAAYRQAVAEGYRFFSYGDACFITPHPGALAR